MTLLADVQLEGIYSAMPAFGNAGRLYFATDTNAVYKDTGTAWIKVLEAGGSFALVPLAPSAPGNFTVAHGLAYTPSGVVASMTSGGQIWVQPALAADATNLYLVASDSGVTGNAVCFK